MSIKPVKSYDKFILPDMRDKLIDFGFSQSNKYTILYMSDGSVRIINNYTPDQLEGIIVN